MEKALGVGLATRWLGMNKRELHKLASSFVEVEKKLFDLLRSIGSIYFKEDLPSEPQAPLYRANTEECLDSETFCVGPTADYMFWYGRRAGLDIRRGPCKLRISTFLVTHGLTLIGINANDYLASIAQNQVKWTRQYGKPLELDFPHNGVFPGTKSPS